MADHDTSMSKGKDQNVTYIEDDVEKDLKDFSHNVETRVRNPLTGIPKHELRQQVDGFCREYGFEDELDTFQKAALVAQRPDEIEVLEELTEDDKHWLRMETTNRWKLPWRMYMCIGIVSIGSAIQ